MQAVNDTLGEMPGQENMGKLNAAMKHEEEIQRHIEEANLPPYDVAMYVLENGSTGQKISALQHLDKTLSGQAASGSLASAMPFSSTNGSPVQKAPVVHTKESEKQVSRIMNMLSDSMWQQDQELQLAAPGALVSSLPLLSQASLILLLNGVKAMLEVRTVEVRIAWKVLAVEIAGKLNADNNIREMVPLALKKADHSEPQDQRTLCCSLIGSIGSVLSSKQMVDTVLTRALAMCQDTDAGVRVAMCDHLAEVARAVGLDVTKSRITHELFELLVDEEKLVSRAAFTCLIDLVEFFDPPYRREHFYPIIRSYISAPPDEVLSLLIEEFGRFLWKIRSDIQGVDDTILFANFFRQSAQKPDPEVRRMCAYNLPAVVASLPRSTYATHITQITRALAVDTHPPVRRAIAAGLHELFTLLSDKASYYLKEPFTSLLSDPTPEVRTLLMKNIDPMLQVFGNSLKAEERTAFFTQIAPAFVQYEAAVQKDWRKVDVIFRAFNSFPSYFSGQVINDKFLPILVRHLQFGSSALKPQCCNYIIQFAKKIEDNQLIVDVFGKVIQDTFGRSQSCYNRISYIHLFVECAPLYSRKFIRDRMLETVCGLADDPVLLVKIALVKALPSLKSLMRPPVEEDYKKHYDKALCTLQNDPSPEILQQLCLVQPRLDEFEGEFNRVTALRIPNPADEAAQKKLEDGEGDLLEMAKEQERAERRIRIREMLKNERETLAQDTKKIGGKRPVVPGRTTTTGIASGKGPAAKVTSKVSSIRK